MSALRKTARRRAFTAVRRGLGALPAPERELALALASRSQQGPTLLPGPPPGPVLVVAPHPDDEVIGPGGTLARHHDAGDEIRILVLTSGGATSGGAADVERQRERETIRALDRLGVRVAPTFGRLTDGGLPQEADAVVALLQQHGQDAASVYVPGLLDPHPDHRAATTALTRTKLPDDVLVLGYEVWAAGPVDVLVDVTDVFARKQAALGEYAIALQSVDYVRSASGLAAYRSAAGMLGGRGFAEGFTAMSLGELRALT